MPQERYHNNALRIIQVFNNQIGKSTILKNVWVYKFSGIYEIAHLNNPYLKAIILAACWQSRVNAKLSLF